MATLLGHLGADAQEGSKEGDPGGPESTSEK